MGNLNEIIGQIELHSIEGIRKCFSEGVNPNANFKNELLIYELTSEYTRSPRFKDCVKAFVDHGLEMDDKILLSVLLDDAKALDHHLQNNPQAVSRRYALRCAYTPLQEASILHICAEFNHVACAKVIVKHGVDINVKAGSDENGFGGQTPIFHTVNQNLNQSSDMMDFLLSHSADLKTTITGLT
jgi:ankyrin repeat protein